MHLFEMLSTEHVSVSQMDAWMEKKKMWNIVLGTHVVKFVMGKHLRES